MFQQALLIENHFKPNIAIREWASGNGCSLTCMGNGIEALLWLGKGNLPDLIFAEAEMGLIPAYQFVQYIKSSGFYQDIPVIAFGNEYQQKELAAMMQSGAADFLIVPFSDFAVEKKVQILQASSKAS